MANIGIDQLNLTFGDNTYILTAPDFVLSYTDLANFPAEGEVGKIYVAQDTNILYRWDATESEYIALSAKFEDSRTFTVQGTVTNESGAYSHDFSNSEISSDSRAISIELGTPSIFRDEISVTCHDGYATVSCNNVVGSSTIKVAFFKSVYPVEVLPDANGVSF